MFKCYSYKALNTDVKVNTDFSVEECSVKNGKEKFTKRRGENILSIFSSQRSRSIHPLKNKDKSLKEINIIKNLKKSKFFTNKKNNEKIYNGICKTTNLIIDDSNMNSNNADINNLKIRSKKRASTSYEQNYFENLKNKIFMEETYLKGTNRTESASNNNPYIYSYKNWTPFSFMTGHYKYGITKEGLIKSPSPMFIENDLWMRRPNLTKEGILSSFEISDTDGIKLINPNICKKFDGILSDLIGQILKVLVGKKISMNVKLFSPTSLTQSFTNFWSFLPQFIPKASQCTDALERMKLVIAFAFSGLYIGCYQLKPFNPLISETFQGSFENPNDNEYSNTQQSYDYINQHNQNYKFSDYNNSNFTNPKPTTNNKNLRPPDPSERIDVYTEQVSNYPTVTRFYVLNKNFTVHGYYDVHLEIKSFGNKVVTITKGYTKVTFPHLKEEIMYTMPNSKLTNAIKQNDRAGHYSGEMIFIDRKNNLKAVVQIGSDKDHIHMSKGFIFKYNFDKDYKFDYDKEWDYYHGEKLEKHDHIKKNIISEINGSWLHNLCIDNKIYWDINYDIPYWIKPAKNALPSDLRFREDLIWLFRSFFCAKNEEQRLQYENLSNEWKLILEKLQRAERENKEAQKKIREKQGKK